MDPDSRKQVFLARTVVWEHAFTASTAEIFGSLERADEALRALEFAIAREPHSFATRVYVGPPTIYCIKTLASRSWPCVVIYYSCTDHQVTLLEIHRSVVGDNV